MERRQHSQRDGTASQTILQNLWDSHEEDERKLGGDSEISL